MEQTVDADPARLLSRRRVDRTWREGGPTVARWNVEMLGWAVLALGVGVLGANAAGLLLPASTAGLVSQLVLWAAFVAPVGVALRRSRPRGLLRFRVLDLMYAVVFGVALRIAQGALAGIGGAPVEWPSAITVDGSLPTELVTDAALGTLVAPVLEELFFRGLVLVAAYTALRRIGGRVGAGVAAGALSTALFVAAHLLVAPAGVADVLSLALVGAVAAAFVLGTGRLWPAVLIHVVFNATGYALVIVGTLLS